MIEIIQVILLVAIVALLLIKNWVNLGIVKSKKERLALLDSCSVIDGRILELAKAGFIPAKLVVPEFILAELQYWPTVVMLISVREPGLA